MFDGKSILVTGGTGSFGRCFVKTILERFRPKRLVVYSRDELKQYDMAADLPNTAMRFFLGDVRDAARLRTAFAEVDFVVHAAALKQVPAAEYNPMEFIRTNVNGAENVIQAALDCGVEKIIALSTDKACNPINLYGATKLCADKLFVAANNVTGSRRTRFSVVRYGNVIGSRGSVVPLFRRLLERGARDLPVTSPEMTRFWITLQQGVDFVIRSFSRMKGGEMFVPKIPSMRVVDLVQAMAPGISARIVGIRPGEKLHEVMCPADDSQRTIDMKDHYVIEPTIAIAHPVDYLVNAANERGDRVPAGFEYNSASNPWFLSVEELRSLNETL